jgi:hypothetical protein
MIDMATYTKMHGRHKRSRQREDSELDQKLIWESWPRRVQQEEDLTDTQVLVLPAHIPAYSLREKIWSKYSTHV